MASLNRTWVKISVIVALLVQGTVCNTRCVGQPDGVFINDFTACDAFFTCFRDEAIPGTCPIGFVFNEESQLCDHPWNVRCLICPQDESAAPTLEPIEGECSFYSLCFQGIGALRECAEGLLFDATRGICDLAENVDCEVGVCPTNINPGVPTFVPDPADCSSYFLCFNGQAESLQCAPSLLFNPETRVCDLEENVECIEGTVPSPTTCPPTGIHYIGNPQNCNSYFVCLNGVQSDVAIDCADGLIFDMTDSICRIANEDSRCANGEPPNVIPNPPLP